MICILSLIFLTSCEPVVVITFKKIFGFGLIGIVTIYFIYFLSKELIKFIKFYWNLFIEKLNKDKNVEEMYCDLNREFHQCEIHRCSTFGCYYCQQYLKIKK